jgi:hypothetical protein
MMATLILHIGRGKTGTTSLQRALTAHRKALQSQGVHYVQADDNGGGHQNFAKSFIVTRPSYMKMPVDPIGVRALVRAEIREVEQDTILLSSENFTLASLPELKKFIAELPQITAVKIVLFVRSQDELAESQYNQMIKLGRVASSFHDYILREMDETDFHALASPWADAFGEENLTARVYNANSQHLWPTFLSALGIPPAQVPAQTAVLANRNESVGYIALGVMRLLNGIDFPDRARIYNNISTLLHILDFPALLFNAVDARRYRERFAASNLAFSQRFLGVPLADLGGRRYDDVEREAIRMAIAQQAASRLLNMEIDEAIRSAINATADALRNHSA